MDSYRMPQGEDARWERAVTIGGDGFALLTAVYGPEAPGWLGEVAAVEVLRRAWVQQYHRTPMADGGQEVGWREGTDLPPGRLRLSSPYDPDARYSVTRGSGWDGYTVHWDAEQVCCPRGCRSSNWRVETSRGVPLIRVTFGKADCLSCPMRSRCTSSKTSGRNLTLRPREQHEALERARAEQATEA